MFKSKEITENQFNQYHRWFYFFHIRNCCLMINGYLNLLIVNDLSKKTSPETTFGTHPNKNSFLTIIYWFYHESSIGSWPKELSLINLLTFFCAQASGQDLNHSLVISSSKLFFRRPTQPMGGTVFAFIKIYNIYSKFVFIYLYHLTKSKKRVVSVYLFVNLNF